MKATITVTRAGRPGTTRQGIRPLLRAIGVLTLVVMTACAAEPSPPGHASSSTTSTADTPSSDPDAAPTGRPDTPAFSGGSSTLSAPTPPARTASPTSGPGGLQKPPGLVGDRRNAFAFAALDNPGRVTVEGRVRETPAWSTSKVLVVAAFLKSAGGDPEKVSATNRRLITAALTRSDAHAVVRIRRQIRGRPGPAMTSVLRTIGDTTTVAPDNYQGLMSWSLREQVRFMAAIATGKLVSRPVSAYLMATMHPVRAHAWGLGTIGAVAYKGGWLRSDTPTRQMGVVDGFAVAIITDRVGPAVRQTDGDSAHVQQMNRLARLLQLRLAYEKSHR